MALSWISQPWPWYVAGPIIGLFVPLLLWVGNRSFGLSASLRHVCAATCPGRSEFLRYDWKGQGLWNLVFVVGVLAGGFIGGTLLANPEPFRLSEATVRDLAALGLTRFDTIVPPEIFSWAGLATAPGLILLVGGGFLVGFGARYAGGCTSGHAITGLASLQLPSLIAVLGFFAGGLAATHLLLPWVLR